MGEYKYFDEIIKQRDNIEVMKLLNREIDVLCSDMIKSIASPVNNWEEEFIFKKDFVLYANFINAGNKPNNYCPKMIRQIEDYDSIFNGFKNKIIAGINTTPSTAFAKDVINEIHKEGLKANFNLEDIDLAGKIKIIEYRLLKEKKGSIVKDTKKSGDFIKFIEYLLDLRKDIDGHASISDRENFSNRNVRDKIHDIYNYIPQVVNGLDDLFQHPEGIKRVLNDFKNYKMESFIKEFDMAFFPENTGLSKKKTAEPTTPIDSEEIYAYNIFIDYSAMISKYNQVLTQKLFEKIKAGRKKFYYDKQSIVRLKETVYSQNGILSERARNFQHELNSMRDYSEWLESDSDGGSLYPTDYITNMLGRLKGYWCFITADREFASEVWATGKDTLIAVAPNDDRKSFIILDKDTVLENKNIEYSIGEEDIDNDFIVTIITANSGSEEKPLVENAVDQAEKSENDHEYIWVDQEDLKEERQGKNREETSQEDGAGISRDTETEIKPAQESQENKQAEEKESIESQVDRANEQELEEKPIIPTSGGKVKGTFGVAPLETEIGSGGEAVVYDIGYGDKYVKIYKKDAWSKTKINKIEEMVKDRGDFSDNDQICWPQEIVSNISGQPIGFMMTRAGGQTGNSEIQSLDSLLTDIRAGEKSEWKRVNLVDICRQMAIGFRKLHSGAIFMGDVNPSNLFVHFSKNANDELLDIKVFFIDVDSYQYKEYHCPVGLKEYTSPRIIREYEGKPYSEIYRTKEDESFATAVLYYYILFLSEFPFRLDYNTRDIKESIRSHLFLHGGDENVENTGDSLHIWNNLTERLKKMFRDVFCEEKYIDDVEWIDAFSELIAQITDKRSSNLIFPEYFLKDDGDIFITENCEICGDLYQITESEKRKEKHHLCNSCKKTRLRHLRKIYYMQCPQCGKKWTANEWDLLENISDTDALEGDFENNIAKDRKCPDCDDSFKISLMEECNYEEGESDRKERIRKLFKAAMTNYDKQREA